MAYDRDDRRYGQGGDRNRFDERQRGFGGGGRGDYGRDPRGYDYQDRGFMERAGDEVRSWFGDEDAERRRQADDRYNQRDDNRGYGSGRDQGYGQSSYGAGDRGYGQTGYRNRDQASGRDQVSRDWGSRDTERGQGRSAFDRDQNVGYGQNYGAERSFGGDYSQQSRGRHDHDPSYRSWRDRQMDSFDRDYDEYRREHQSRFDQEFHSWRQGRQGQRDLLGKVQEHAEVVGSDGQHVGTVDHVKGDQIELTKNDKDAGGQHHLIPSSWIQTVEGNKVTLSKTADQAKQHWRDEARDAGGDRGALNRGFSKTY